MKIAIPVKMNKENPALAPLFGKAKWFSIVENAKVRIEKNPVSGGQSVVKWLADNGVDTIIMQEMGMNPYKKIQSYGSIKLYHAGFERILLEDVLKKFESNMLPELNDESMVKVIAHHEVRHPAHDVHVQEHHQHH